MLGQLEVRDARADIIQGRQAATGNTAAADAAAERARRAALAAAAAAAGECASNGLLQGACLSRICSGCRNVCRELLLRRGRAERLRQTQRAAS